MTRMIALLTWLALPGPVFATTTITDVICYDRETMLQRLQQTHRAERYGRGMRGPDALLEIWSIPSTGEWTLVQTYASGKSCIVAMGEHWEALVSQDPV
ncbi:MAG: hypothetical protein AAFR73_02365 [Pseudomonadota bacterium]